MKEDVRDPLFGVKLYCQNVQVLCFSDDRISKRHKGIQMIYSLYIFNKIKFPVANSTFKITSKRACRKSLGAQQIKCTAAPPCGQNHSFRISRVLRFLSDFPPFFLTKVFQ